MSVRNFKKFEVDKWYIYTGTERPGGWNNGGKMDVVLDHKPVKCIKSAGYNASFDKCKRDTDTWIWISGFDNWIEIKDPNENQSIEETNFLYNTYTKEVKSASQFGMYAGKKVSGNPYYVLTRPPLSEQKDKDGKKLFKFEIGDIVSFNIGKVSANCEILSHFIDSSLKVVYEVAIKNINAPDGIEVISIEEEKLTFVKKGVKEFTGFKEGWYYRYKRTDSKKPEGFVSDMGFFFDGNWHKCLKTDSINYCYCYFDESAWFWFYSGSENFHDFYEEMSPEKYHRILTEQQWSERTYKSAILEYDKEVISDLRKIPAAVATIKFAQFDIKIAWPNDLFVDKQKFIEL